MRFSLELFSSIQGVETLREDEILVASSIRSKLSSQDAVRFDKLHNDLRIGVIVFFFHIINVVFYYYFNYLIH